MVVDEGVDGTDENVLSEGAEFTGVPLESWSSPSLSSSSYRTSMPVVKSYAPGYATAMPVPELL